MAQRDRLTLQSSNKVQRRGLMTALDRAHAIVWFGADGFLEEANPNAQDFLGAEPDLIGLRLADLAGEGADPHRIGYWRRHWRTILTGEIRSEAMAVLGRQRKRYPCVITYTAMIGDDGAPRQVMVQLVEASAVAAVPGSNTLF